MKKYLSTSQTLDVDHPALQSFVEEHTDASQSKSEKAVKLFYAVRDTIRYNPYRIDFGKEAMRASKTLDRGHGHCMDKAALLVAVYRAVGIPARIGLAKVKNHISTEKLEDFLGSNVLAPHGYTEVYLDHTWWKVTPAFNLSLCQHLGVEPLTFDGANHCLFQAYDREGGKFMEYLVDYGTFPDVPIAFIRYIMEVYHPKLIAHLSEEQCFELRA